MSEISGFELKLGSNYYLFRGSENPFNNNSSSNIAADKYCTNKLLEQAGIPVPKSVALHRNEFQQHKTEELIPHLTFPLVIKPLLNGSQGKDVLCNIQTMEELQHFLSHYFNYYEYLMIEEFHGNLKSYRVLVFNKRVIGVVLRHPAKVTGDGIHTIEELVELTNKQRKEISDFLGPIRIDEECLIKLKELNIGTNYIPAVGEKVVLCYTSNATRGGTFEAQGDTICRANRKLMIQVASRLNLALTGIDVECEDINLPIQTTRGVIIEVNHRPSIRIHELPIHGSPHLVTRKIMKSFIYKHPLSYLHALYSNKPTSSYMRLSIVILVLALITLFAV